MTPEDLAVQIEQDIGHKGGARVPMVIIQEVFSEEMRASQTLDAALEEFANSHDWHVRYDTSPIPRVIFSPVEVAGELSEKKGDKK